MLPWSLVHPGVIKLSECIALKAKWQCPLLRVSLHQSFSFMTNQPRGRRWDRRVRVDRGSWSSTSNKPHIIQSDWCWCQWYSRGSLCELLSAQYSLFLISTPQRELTLSSNYVSQEQRVQLNSTLNMLKRNIMFHKGRGLKHNGIDQAWFSTTTCLKCFTNVLPRTIFNLHFRFPPQWQSVTTCCGQFALGISGLLFVHHFVKLWHMGGLLITALPPSRP